MRKKSNTPLHLRQIGKKSPLGLVELFVAAFLNIFFTVKVTVGGFLLAVFLYMLLTVSVFELLPENMSEWSSWVEANRWYAAWCFAIAAPVAVLAFHGVQKFWWREKKSAYLPCYSYTALTAYVALGAGCALLLLATFATPYVFGSLGVRTPSNAYAYTQRGDNNFWKKDYDSAIIEYNEAIALNPNYARAYEARGRAYFVTGKHDFAIVDYLESIRLEPTSDRYYRLGDAYSAKQEYDTAISAFEKMVKLEPNNVFNLYRRGIAYQNMGNVDRAIADYNRAIRRRPTDAGFLISRGNAYFTKGDTDHAISDYSHAIRLDPKEAYAYYFRGLLKQMLGDIEGAATDLIKAKQLRPGIGEQSDRFEIG